MAKKKRARMLGLVSALAVIAVMIPIQFAGTAGATHIDYGYTGPVMGQKILSLHTTNVTGDSDRFYLHGTSTQDVIGTGNGNAKCKMRLGTGATGATVAGDLVTLRAYGRTPATGAQALSTSWAVGFSNTDNSIGVASEPSNNTKCAQVNEVSPTSEVLSLALNNDSGSLSGWYWDTLELDLEAKFRPPHVYYSLYWDGSPVPGQTKVDLPICTDPTADCGPDSTDSDNWRVAIPQPDGQGAYPSVLFDEVRIWPESDGGTVGNGSIDLKGGSDGTAAFCLSGDKPCTEWGLAGTVSPGAEASVTDSLFRLVLPAEGQICPEDDPGTEEVENQATEPTGSGTATVTYLNGTECKPYLFTYARDPLTNEREVEFLASGADTVTFEVAVTDWDPEPAYDPATGDPVAVKLSTTDPAGVDADPAGEFCEGTFEDPQMPKDGLGNYLENWCAFEVVARPYGLDGDGSTGNPDWVPGYEGQLIKVTERWLLIGDAKMNR